MAPFERAMAVSYRIPIVTIRYATSNHRMSMTLKSTGGHFMAKFGEKGVDQYKTNFNTVWERHGAVVCKRNRVNIFCRLSTMHERDRQTNRQTDSSQNGNIDRNRLKIQSAYHKHRNAVFTVHKQYGPASVQ